MEIRLRPRLATRWWAKILIDHDTEPAELFSGVTKITLGLYLLAPWETFAASPRLYADVATVPEQVWGLGLVVLGAGHLAALRGGEVGWRRAAAFGAFLVWVSFGGTFVHTQPTALIGPLMLLLAGALGWVWIRLGILLRYQQIHATGAPSP